MIAGSLADEAGVAATSVLDRFGVPGAALAIVSGHGSFAWGHGFCEAGSDQRVTPTTTFAIASCSKAYTAVAAAILVDRGELSWDAPVRAYLPEFQLHDEMLTRSATVRDLLGMRLGYRNEGLVNWGRNTEHGLRFVFERMRHMEVVSRFRESFTYLNPAYSLVAEIIARIGGEDFPSMLDRVVIAPLGLKQTFVCEGRYFPSSPHAMPHVTLPSGEVTSLGQARCGGRIGEACVYSSAADAAVWMQLFLQKGMASGARLVSEAAMKELCTPQVAGAPVPALNHSALAYCVGWQRRETPDGPILLHEGAEFGASTYTLLDPERMLGVSVYLNLASAPAAKACGYALLDLLAGRPARDWAGLFARLADEDRSATQAAIDQLCAQATLDCAPEALAGQYYSLASGVADVMCVGDGLRFQLRDGWVYDGELSPIGGGVFRIEKRYAGMYSFAQKVELKARFSQDARGITLWIPGLGSFARLDVPERSLALGG